MLEKPELPDDKIVACLQEAHGLSIVRIDFLPLGADTNTAVYRAVSTAGEPYFVKLRRGDFNSVAVTLPAFLHEQGLRQIISPLPAGEGRLWAELDPYNLILYPFVNGRDGFGVALTPGQWHDFGAAVRFFHTTVLPPALARLIPHEMYPPHWRHSVRVFLKQAEREDFQDPLVVKLAAFLRLKRDLILDMVGRAEQLARKLQAEPPKLVLCHNDLHAGNLLVDDRGDLYILDWDDPIFAPKERDLMFIGGGQGFIGYSSEDEEKMFNKGYGLVQVDHDALAYYRFERVLVDVALFCEQIFSSLDGGEDREQALRYLQSNFQPNGTIEMAYRAEQRRKAR